MNRDSLPSELLAKSRARLAELPAPAGDGPVSPGQVLLLPEITDPRLAWVVLRCDASDGHEVLLAAADVNPLAGSADVVVEVPGLGPLTLRCGYTAWRREVDFGAPRPLGALPVAALAQADTRWQALATDRHLGTLGESEIDADPEYQNWIAEVIEPAQAALLGHPASAPAPAAVTATPVPDRLTPSPRPLPSWLALAAGLVCVGLALGSSLLLWRQSREIAALRLAASEAERTYRAELTDLEAQRAKLEADFARRLAAAGADHERLVAEHREEVARLEKRVGALRQASTIRNPVFAELSVDDVVRGSAEEVVGPEVSHVVLVLWLEDATTGGEYRVEIAERRPGGAMVFEQGGLRADMLGRVALGVPAALLPPGRYRVRLLDAKGGVVQEHQLTIEPPPKKRGALW